MPIIFVDHKTPTPVSEESVEPENLTSSELANIAANIDASQENLNNTDYDDTWGGKKSRYLYDYAIEDTSENSDDTNETESVLSIQSKTTMVLESEPDIVVGCPSNCQCRKSNRGIIEYEPASSSSSFNMDDSSYSSESTVLMDYEFSQKMVTYDASQFSSDTGFAADETNPDDQKVTKVKKVIPPPACFKLCLQCRQQNPNAYFQYCYSCFKNRMNFFQAKPKPSKKRRRNTTICTKSNNSFVDHQKPGPSNLHQSDSVSINTLFSQTIIDQTKNIGNDTIDKRKNTNNMCKVCFMMPQNGVFNHGKVSHIYSCYNCTKNIYKQSRKCPICNIKVQFITKMIVV